jgi:argininosuccinate lyase
MTTIRTTHEAPAASSLTGRISAEPSALLHTAVLEPQFVYERQHLLRWYVLIEKVLLLEYERLGVIDRAAMRSIAIALNEIGEDTIAASPQANMSDIAFAIERHVEARGLNPPQWHVDRSRNDFQACAQLLFGRELLFSVATHIHRLATVVCRRASETAELLMPGYTHFQAAQVISPGFYLAAMCEQLVGALRRLLTVYDAINRCPLGAGAMAGQELPWNRERMAELLGFAMPAPHALVAVASREWVLQIGAELSMLGVALSRFATDLMLWGSSEYQFIDLPDSLAGISSAMPQKKNFPVLERIRGKTAHLGAFYVDLMMGQRNTPFSNLVEVSKEAGAQLFATCQTAETVLQLFTAVIEHLRFREARMAQACEREYLGGFALANYLTLCHAIPSRTAQVIAGQYIVAAIEQGLAPQEFDAAMLEAISGRRGYLLQVAPDQARACLLPETNMTAKTTTGSTHPAQTRELIARSQDELIQLGHTLESRAAANDIAYRMIDVLLQL